MSQGTLTARIQIVDDKGNVVGGTSAGAAVFQVDSTGLKEAIQDLTEAVADLRNVLMLVNS